MLGDVQTVVVWFFVIATPFAILIFVEHLINKRRQEQRRNRLRLRPVLPLEGWYKQEFDSTNVKKESAEKIVGLLAACLECHPTQILAADRFAEELHFEGVPFFVSSGDIRMEHFRCQLESLLADGEAPNDLPIDQPKTVDELVAMCDAYVPEDQEL